MTHAKAHLVQRHLRPLAQLPLRVFCLLYFKFPPLSSYRYLYQQIHSLKTIGWGKTPGTLHLLSDC